MDWPTIITFTVVAGLLVISPGPNSILIAKTVPASGRLAGFANVAGFVSAFYLHGALVIFGVSVILVRSAELFFLVKMVGACYLCWIGVKAIWEAWRGATAVPEVRVARVRRTLAAAYLEGFLTNALNPKVAVFYLAAFPQFLSMDQQGVGSTFILVFIHAALNFVWFGAMVLVLSRFVGHLRSGGLQRVIKGVTGIVLLGFGARLAVLRP